MLKPSDNSRFYETLCLAALVGVFLLLLARGVGSLVLLPLLIGVGGLAGRGRWGGKPLTLWRAAPFALVVCLAFLAGPMAGIFAYLPLVGGSLRLQATTLGEDALLALAVLGYLAGHFRLQGLELTPLPVDARRPEPAGPSRRPVPAGEFVVLVLELAACVALAVLVWDRLPADRDDLEMDPALWRCLILAWLIGVPTLVAGSLLVHLGRLRQTRAEAELALQDEFWRETRREQRRLGRWLAWRAARAARPCSQLEN